jgi:hypothetical protein
MSSFYLRPRFSHSIDLGVEAARERIVRGALQDENRCEVKSFPGYISLHVLEKDSHYWSPRLSLSLEPEGDNKTQVNGTYGPNTNVWAAFLYGYLLVGSAGLFSGLLGACQLWLEMRPWGLGLFLVAVVVMAGMYVSAQLGQKIGAQQMFLLHQIYERAVGQSAEIK